MKTSKLILLLAAFCYTWQVAAQDNDKTIYGSFILNKQVFKYDFTSSRSGNLFRLSSLAGLDDAIKKLDTNRLIKTIDYIDSIDSNFLNKMGAGKDLIKSIPGYLRDIKDIRRSKLSVWDANRKNIDMLIDTVRYYKVDAIQTTGIKEDERYTIETLLGQYRTFLDKIDDPKSSEPLPVENMQTPAEFKEIFNMCMTQLLGLDNFLKISRSDNSYDETIRKVFYEMKTRISFEDLEPVTANLILKKKMIALPLTYVSASKIREAVKIKYPLDPEATEKKTQKYIKKIAKESRNKISKMVLFEVEDIQMEFEGGTVKNIFADLVPVFDGYQQEYQRLSVRFRNNMPIPVDGKFDPERFANHQIFLGNARELRDALGTLPDMYDGISSSVSFRLSELVDYKIIPEVNKEDYSPADIVVNISPLKPVTEVKKDKSSRLFDFRLYSDFIGLNENEPNGLVQIEASKKINFITKRWQGVRVPTPWFIKFGKRKPNNYTGFLTYVEPKFTFAKIENNNRILPVDSSNVDLNGSFAEGHINFYVSPLALMQHQFWNFNNDINLIKINLLNVHTTIYLDGHVNFTKTLVGDSLQIADTGVTGPYLAHIPFQNVRSVNTTGYGFSLGLEFKPDSRFNIIFKYGWNYIDVYHSDYNTPPRYFNLYHTASADAFFVTGPVSKMFIRGQKLWMFNNPRENFYRLQLGYQLDLFTGSKLNQPK